MSLDRTTRETTRRDRRELLRWLAGELDEAAGRRLRRRLADEPELARAAAALRRTWDGLADPAGAAGGAVPPGFAGRVMARVREEAAAGRRARAVRGFGGPVPAWARAAGAAALVLGLAAGAGMGVRLPRGGEDPAAATVPATGAGERAVAREGGGERLPAAAETADTAGRPAGGASGDGPAGGERIAATSGAADEIPDTGAVENEDAAELAALYAELYGDEIHDGLATDADSLADGYAAALAAAFGGEEGT
jgi:hypothetical protein